MTKRDIPTGWGFSSAEVSRQAEGSNKESILDWLVWLYQGIDPDLMKEPDGSPEAAARLAGDLAKRIMTGQPSQFELDAAGAILLTIASAKPSTLIELFGLATGHRRPEHWRQHSIAMAVSEASAHLKSPAAAYREVAKLFGLSPSRVKQIYLKHRSVDSLLRQLMCGDKKAEAAHHALDSYSETED